MNRSRTFLIQIVFLLTIAYSGSTDARETARTPEERQVVDRDKYEALLQGMFHTPAWNPQMLFRINVIVRPSFTPEWQLVITRWQESKADAQLVSAASNVYGRLNALPNSSDQKGLEQTASAIGVSRQNLTLSPGEAERLRAGLFQASKDDVSEVDRLLKKELDEHIAEIVLDGSYYSVNYEQGTTEFHFSFYDEESGSRTPGGRFAVVRWINSTRERLIRNGLR